MKHYRKTDKEPRYRVAECRRAWNRLAKPGHKISKWGMPGLIEDCRKAHAETGRRELEMGREHTQSGHAELIGF